MPEVSYVEYTPRAWNPCSLQSILDNPLFLETSLPFKNAGYFPINQPFGRSQNNNKIIYCVTLLTRLGVALQPGKGITIPEDPVVGCECTDCSNSQNTCCAKQMSSFFAYTKYGRLKVGGLLYTR